MEEKKDRQQEIREKGFNMAYSNDDQYGKIKVGVQTLEDAVLALGSLKDKTDARVNKQAILRALADKDISELRKTSTYFYNINGIYSRTCNYFATLYRYDWYIVPEIQEDKKSNNDKICKEFSEALNYLDNSYISKLCGEIALKAIKNGAYYGYLVDSKDQIIIQELPVEYCRSRYFVRNKPVVEFNMKFFDDNFSDPGYRLRILKMFPDEFAKGYLMYKQGKIKPDTPGQLGSWYVLNPDFTVKFNVNDNDIPMFVNAIPAILDLDAAQDLDRRKQMQKLLKIIVQKLPRDKNDNLIFDVDEARDIHNNAVQMLSRAVGLDVLTTFTDVQSIDLSDRNTATTKDDLEKMERAVYNSFGISQNLFNTDGNMSLGMSILNDESAFRNLLLQFEMFFNDIVMKKYSNKKYKFKFYMLETTQYNYKELSKTYKEQVQLGYSKMLPQIALGHSQSAIINTAYFENSVLKLSEIMIPPLMSSTMSSEDVLGKKNESTNKKAQKALEGEKEPGRPEKPDDQKSDKTIQNKESMS